MAGKRKYRRSSLPPLPCGCKAAAGEGNVSRTKVIAYGDRTSGVLLHDDGTRVCLKHGRRFEQSWKEIGIVRLSR